MQEPECAEQVEKRRRFRLQPGVVFGVGLAVAAIGVAVLWFWGTRYAGLLPDVAGQVRYRP